MKRLGEHMQELIELLEEVNRIKDLIDSLKFLEATTSPENRERLGEIKYRLIVMTKAVDTIQPPTPGESKAPDYVTMVYGKKWTS